MGPVEGRGCRLIRWMGAHRGACQWRGCRRLAGLPQPLLRWGVIRGRTGQGEGLQTDQGGGGPSGVWLVGDRACRRLSGQPYSLLGWEGVIWGGPDTGRGFGPIMVGQADWGRAGQGKGRGAWSAVPGLD